MQQDLPNQQYYKKQTGIIGKDLPVSSPAIGSNPIEDSILIKIRNMLENQWSNWLPSQLDEVEGVPLIVIPLLSNLNKQ